jgi:hypothetical protein
MRSGVALDGEPIGAIQIGGVILLIVIVVEVGVFAIVVKLVNMTVLMQVRELVGTRNDLAIIARKPASNLVDHAVPPTTFELGDDLDHIALVEAQASPVVGLVVIQSADVHDARWRGADHAIHDGEGYVK